MPSLQKNNNYGIFRYFYSDRSRKIINDVPIFPESKST